MKLSGLLGNRQQAPPGVTGTARVQRRGRSQPWRRDFSRQLKPGDIAVLDQADIDRRVAEQLIAAEVAGVVNARAAISGRYPNVGPEVLLASGIPLIDEVGDQALQRIKDGSTLRLHECEVFTGRGSAERMVARGVEHDAQTVAARLIDAKAAMTAQLEAFSANTIEFLRDEGMLVLESAGLPELAVSLHDRHVLVVAPGCGADDVKRLRGYLREFHPVLFGVNSGADAINGAGYRPDVIVGDPELVETATLKRGGEVVVPAHFDGYAPGLERVQDLGVPAATLSSSGNAEDLALLLADAGDPCVVVTLGMDASLREFLDSRRSGSNPCTFLTRMRLGGKLVDASAVAALQRNRVPTSMVLLLIVAVVAVAWVALAVSGVGQLYFGVGIEPGTVPGLIEGLFS